MDEKVVCIGIVFSNNKVLMIKRAKKEGNLAWAFPGGKLEENETLEQCCIREVFEETGIKCKVVSKIKEKIHPDTKVKINFFKCYALPGQEIVLNKNECEHILWVERNKVSTLITSNFDNDVCNEIENQM